MNQELWRIQRAGRHDRHLESMTSYHPHPIRNDGAFLKTVAPNYKNNSNKMSCEMELVHGPKSCITVQGLKWKFKGPGTVKIKGPII